MNPRCHPLLITILLIITLIQPAFSQPQAQSPSLPAIRLNADKTSFIQSDSPATPTPIPFRIWGVNYDHDTHGEHGRLLEDYWLTEWDTVREDFAEIKALGANVIRIHLQLGKFMLSPEEPNPTSLAQLTRLLRLAEETGLYLNLTGLGCYHKADVPAWYDAMDETARWKTQANFWTAIARTCKNANAVFCYDLMNEPVASGAQKDGWLAGELGGKHYVQRLTLEPGARTAIEIAHAWVKLLTTAIRAEDPDHLITVGVIPWAHVWPNAKPVFYSPEVAPMLDFVSIHLYPGKGEAGLDRALTALKIYQIGKPIVIEETFPLSCSIEEMNDFITKSKHQVSGYFSFYWGRTAEEYAKPTPNIKPETAALVQAWLTRFQQLAPEMK